MSNDALEPGEATELIRSLVGPSLDVLLTGHAKERMEDRGLLMGDILHVLKNGYVYEPGEPASKGGYFKYLMECKTPNSGGRVVRVVVIPGLPKSNQVKLVSVMWKDEK